MKPEDFEQMQWRLDLCKPNIVVIEEYDELYQRFRKFSLESIKILKEITNDQLVRFIVFGYHKNSPFVRKITDPKHRKQQALLEAGVKLNLEEVKEIIDCESQIVAEMIFSFLVGENNIKYSALMMQTDAYYKMNFKLAYGENLPTKNSIDAIKGLEQNIESLAHDVFHGERELANFAKGIMDRNLILSPEMNGSKKV